MDFATEREAMVERQLKWRGIDDPAILDAFRSIPRELFVGANYAHLAYGDHPLPIEAGQTISQPYVVALMIAAAEVGAGDRVLEVGAGSGYAAAVIARLAARVTAIERRPELCEGARTRIEQLGLSNVEIIAGDGTLGFEQAAPFDAVLVAASGSHVPEALVAQLSPGGRLVMPLGARGAAQKLVRVRKGSGGTIERDSLGAVRFVPLIGAEGWNGD